MSLSIIGAGLGRTGTLSLKSALEQLGFEPCFHGLNGSRQVLEQVMGLSIAPRRLGRGLQGLPGGRRCTHVLVYRELARKYPAAKVILTVRDRDAWLESTQALVHSFESVTFARKRGRCGPACGKKMLSGAFGGAVAQMTRARDDDSRIAAYEQHNAEVRGCIPADRLLVFDVKEGWLPLCEFLGVPVPATPFPRLNSRATLPSLLQRLYGEEYSGQPPAGRPDRRSEEPHMQVLIVTLGSLGDLLPFLTIARALRARGLRSASVPAASRAAVRSIGADFASVFDSGRLQRPLRTPGSGIWTEFGSWDGSGSWRPR